VEIESNAAKDLAVKLLESRIFDTAEQMSEAMREVFKELIQIKLEGEMEEMLGYQKNSIEGSNTGNSRNGYTKKSLRTPYGKATVKIPMDRNGEFKPSDSREMDQALPDWDLAVNWLNFIFEDQLKKLGKA
jgi:transposase-like protein